jgi:hypothetical protein
MQSVATVQALPTLHFEVHVPPQSMSVSAPFLMPSVQLAAGG